MTNDTPSSGELLHNLVQIVWFAIRRLNSRQDLPYISLMLTAPLLHLLRFRGELKTPVGKLRIEGNDVLRWSIYGLFKTRFSYMKMLESTPFKNRSRSTIIDVGANLGDFAIAISRKARRIISIEPGRENFLTLCSNLNANRLNQVIPLNIAAHDSTEKLSMMGNGADLTVSSFNGGQHVVGRPLDAVLRTCEIEYVDILKIDVQGHEMKVLQGLTNSLKDHRVGLAIVEVHTHRNIQTNDVVSFMQPLGYHLVATDFLFGRPQLYFEFADN